MGFETPVGQVENNDVIRGISHDVQHLHEPPQTAASTVSDLSGKSADLVKTGLLPTVELDGPIKLDPATRHPGRANWDFSDHSNGADGGKNPWSQPAFQGDAWHGKQHMSPQEKLWNAEYQGLAPADKIKYNAENQAATKYSGDHMTWELTGKKGPEPTKPDLPEHDKIAAKVEDDKKAIEKQVRNNMTPDEQAKYDKAKAEYTKAEAGATFGSNVPVPPEVAAYNKKIAEATGLKTESEKDFIAGQFDFHDQRVTIADKH